LTKPGIKEEDYDCGKKVCGLFGSRTLDHLYLKIEVLLLADVFENFRDLCMSTYHWILYYIIPLLYRPRTGLSCNVKLHWEWEEVATFNGLRHVVDV